MGLKSDYWARNLNDELYRIGLGHICLDRDGMDLKNIYLIIKTRCNNTHRK